MNLADAYHFGAWNTINDGIKRGFLKEEQMMYYKKILMKAICMRDES